MIPLSSTSVVTLGSATGRRVAPRVFLAGAAGAAIVLFGLVWLWVLYAQMTFLDPEYAAWRAKQTMLERCDLGHVMILGDSRAAVAMMPARWTVSGANLAVGGGEPIEALAALVRALRCPSPPNRVILSFDAVHFTQPDLFWERTVPFGWVSAQEIATLKNVARSLHDPSIYASRDAGGMPPWLRDRAEQVRFPSLYFTSLMKAGLLLRWPRNHALYRDAMAAHGQYFFGTAAGSDVVAAEGKLTGFTPLPVLAWYFDQVLRRLDAAGIPALFVAVPMNEATARQVAPEVRTSFRAWLATYEALYPGFRVAGDVMPYWPDAYFGDGYAHLNPDGARRFSDSLGGCLMAETLTEACLRQAQTAPTQTENRPESPHQ